jgi:hypothetical protein
MQVVEEKLGERKREFHSYLRLLDHLEQRMLPRASAKKRSGDLPSSESFKAMKATAFLMLYNIIEATIIGAIAQLYKVIEREGCTLSEVSTHVQDIWIDQRFWIAPDDATPATYQARAARLLRETMANAKLSLAPQRLRVGGNIDADKVRHLCKKHGCPLSVSRHSRGGVELKTVKEQRNDLAHGLKTFVECGQSYGISDIERISRECFNFLGGFVRSLDRYVKKRKYRA